MPTKNRNRKKKRRDKYLQRKVSLTHEDEGDSLEISQATEAKTNARRTAKKLSDSTRYQTKKEELTRRRRARYEAMKHIFRSKARDRFLKSRALIAAKALKRYHDDPEPWKKKTLKRYHDNPEPLKRKILKRYHDNPEPLKRKILKRYHDNPEPLKRKILKRYHDNPEPLKRKIQKRYHDNPDPVKRKNLKRYHDDPEPFKRKSLKRYHHDPKPLNLKRLKRYHDDPEAVKSKLRERYRLKHAAQHHKARQRYVRFRIPLKEVALRRYRLRPCILKQPQSTSTYNNGNEVHACGSKSNTPKRTKPKKATFLQPLHSHKHVNKLMKKLTELGSFALRRHRAELLFKWASKFRQLQIYKFKSTVRKWKQLSCKILVTMQPYLSSPQSLKELSPILGDSAHFASSEPFFSEGVYKCTSANVIPLHEGTTQATTVERNPCNPATCQIDVHSSLIRLRKLCVLIIKTTTENFRSVITRMDLCTSSARDPQKQGHPLSCHIDGHCPSYLLFIRHLAPHFPRMRIILRYFYSVNQSIKDIEAINLAILTSDRHYLEDVETRMREKRGSTFKIGTSTFSSEDEIIERYHTSFVALKKKCNDTPIHPCMSCEKLCCRVQVHFLSNLRSLPTCCDWKALTNFCTENHLPMHCICKLCLQKFRSGTMPSTCLLNNLWVRPAPPLIEKLNPFERILIQRAKCFQVVIRMGTIGGKKNQPPSHSLKKVIGRAFHLPLPLEETLKTIPRPDNALPNDLGLYILVRGVPTKNNKIWQSLVDVKKVHSALAWLKHNNHIYSSINLGSVQQLENHINNINCVFEHEESDEAYADSTQPLLTKMSPDDVFYEHFTICELTESRANQTASDLFQMRKTEAPPLHTFSDKNLDIKCFPDLYPHGDNGQNAERPQPITGAEFCKLRIMSRHPQFRLNQQYIFHLMHENNLRAVQAGIYHKQNVLKTGEKLTSKKCVAAIESGQIEQDLTTIFSRLRNSSQFWIRPRTDITTMIQYYGPVTFFLTLSPSEYRWEDLNTYLCTINGLQPGSKTTSALIAFDPLSTSRFIEIKFRGMIEFITSENDPLGRVGHYAVRREYQTRGLQHFHILLWIENAPIIGESSSEDVANFILKYISCWEPDPTLFPTLHRRVKHDQTHHHNSYCMRKKKTKHGMVQVCRFGFPRNTTQSLVLREVAESIVGRRRLKSRSRLYDLPRTECEQFINDYNPAVLLAWEGNVDIQYIGETSCSLSYYVTKYETKSETTNIDDFHLIANNKSLLSKLWNVAMRGLSNRECGIMEACDALLGYPLFLTDPNTFIKWVDVSMVRKRRLKPKTALQDLDPDSVDIYYPSLVDTHYPNRPLEMESTSLFQYASEYDIIKTRPISKGTTYYDYPPFGFIRHRSSPCLIKHQVFNINNEPENYFFSLLLLFRPWRDISHLKQGFNTYAEACANNLTIIDSEMERHHRRLHHLRRSKDEIESAITRLTTTQQQPLRNHTDIHQEVNIMQQVPSSKLDEMILSLNPDQHRVFTTVTGVVSNPACSPLHHFVSGVGGTGKSFLIKVITTYIQQRLGKTVAVAAPTGVAAYNVGGVTLHRLLNLPVEHGTTPEYKPLSDEALKILRDSLKGVALLIIDEISMVSNITLLYIHLRLTEVFNTHGIQDGWFGNVHILALGDLLQLPPVMPAPPYSDLDKTTTHKYVKGVGYINLWKHLFTYDELTINVRQHSDTDFADILARIRTGTPDPNDITILSKRKISFKGKSTDARRLELATYLTTSSPTVAILPTREQCTQFNATVLSTLTSQEFLLEAVDTLDCQPTNRRKTLKNLNKFNCDSSKTAGLEYSISMKIGCQVMLVRNLDITLGLVNGAIGHVDSVGYDAQQKIDTLNITFNGNQHKIERVTSKFEVIQGGYVLRSQFPITIAYAITVHKSQGMTVSNCLLDIGNSVFCHGQSYVALSRLTTLKGLKLINFDPSKVQAAHHAIGEYNRLREKYRQDLPLIPLPPSKLPHVPDVSWARKSGQSQLIQESKPHMPSSMPPDISIPGFVNNDGVSCYSNATIQALFSSTHLVGSILSEEDGTPLGQLAQLHSSHVTSLLNTYSLRCHLGAPFNLHQQQDPREFFDGLLQISDSTANSFRYTLETTITCSTCTYVSVLHEPHFVIDLHIPPEIQRKRSSTLDELMHEHCKTTTTEGSLCSACMNGTYKQSIRITDPSDLLLVQLILWDQHLNKINNFKLCGVPTSTIKIQGFHYKMISGVFHHGTNPHSGHYTAILRHDSNKFVRANDSLLSFEKHWPSGAKDIYLLLLSRTNK